MSKEGYHSRKPTLDDIVCILCGNDNNHEFVADHPVFQKIIKYSRGLERERSR